MATEPATQVLASSVDARGVAAATTTRGPDDSTQVGSVYSPESLAAAVPVWFHLHNDGSYQAVLRSYWTGATASGGPQWYSDHTPVTVPAWFRFDPATGVRGAVEAIPGSSSPVVAGASSSLYMWLLRQDGTLQWFREDGPGLVLAGSEDLAGQQHRVSWDSDATGDLSANSWWGLEVDGPRLRVYYGTPADGIFVMAKPWGQVGNTHADWLFLGDKGFLPYAGESFPLSSASGPVPCNGPVSLVTVRGRSWLTTVELAGGQYVGRAWSSRGLHDPWRDSGLSVPLGASPGWLGAGVQLQPQLAAAPDAVAAIPANVAVPYVSSVPGTSDGASYIDTAWDLLVVDPR